LRIGFSNPQRFFNRAGIMNYKFSIYFTLLYFFLFLDLCAEQGRKQIPLDNGWTFVYGYETIKQKGDLISLPHTWNVKDAGVGVLNYYRGVGIYRKKLSLSNYNSKRIFIRFEGVNSKAEVFVNEKVVGTHEGGYTAFAFEITDFVDFSKENELMVKVMNSYDPNIPPLVGDFNFYGGIHRPVSMIITESNCIEILDYASAGVYLIQQSVTEKEADLVVKTKLSIKEWTKDLKIFLTIKDRENRVVIKHNQSISKDQIKEISIPLKMIEPKLWNGKTDPYLYKVDIELKQSELLLDKIEQPLGLRFFEIDKENGFFLNGKYLDLYGACRHEDIFGRGSALTKLDHEKDMELIKELGATTIRLTHYPHSSYFYDLLDENGIVTWTEIPLVGPGGYAWQGYTKSHKFHENSKNALIEMVRQNFNHPSIFFWGLYNELKLEGDSPVSLIQELNELLKVEDPTRRSVAATFVEDKELNDITDLIAWNKYYGWYGGDPSMIGSWADVTHKAYPNQPISVSEYGAGASVQHHEEGYQAPSPTGRWHPEGWQAYFHEQHWKALKERPFIWSKHIWLLHDFSASHRTEGDQNGINDKGLVTYDRSTKKDAFYFYKVNWNPEPLIHLLNKRFVSRTSDKTDIKVYSNTEIVKLEVNGVLIDELVPDDVKVAVFKEVLLNRGKNMIKVLGKKDGQDYEDSVEWFVDN